MVLRGLVLALGALLLSAADYPDPPPALAPYIEDGRLKPGDYAWIEGSFADAPPGRKAEFEAIRSWADSCMAQAKNQARESLAAAGFRAASLDGVAIGPLVCRQATIYPRHPELTSYARLRQELVLATPVADSFLMAVGLAAELGNQGGGDTSVDSGGSQRDRADEPDADCPDEGLRDLHPDGGCPGQAAPQSASCDVVERGRKTCGSSAPCAGSPHSPP